MLIKSVKHRGHSNQGGKEKNQTLFPVISPKVFFGYPKGDKRKQEDGRSDAKRDVGMQSDAKNQSGQHKTEMRFKNRGLPNFFVF